MAHSKTFRRRSRLACVAALGLALATPGWTSTRYDGAPVAAHEATPLSLMVQASACKPGRVETLLNGWLDSTKNTDFESDYVAMAFDELVDFVHLLRDIAQDFCV